MRRQDRRQLGEIPGVLLDPEAEGYGLSPLHFAPKADARWRKLFTPEQIEAHLDKTERDQQSDGGWAVTWDPPSEASLLDWRGIVTLGALRTLTSYARLTPAPQAPA